MKIFLVISFLFLNLFAKVDLNNAPIKDLVLLKGIGKKKAEAIVKYRKEHPFKDIKDIMKIKGIGKKLFKAIENDIEIK